jgi:uracil-DNA glycosylase
MTINYMDLNFFSDKWGEIARNLENYIPYYDDILKALNKPKSTTRTKVLILGQDPYPTPGHANGLAFSVRPDVHPLPRSLKNIFRELVDDIGCPYPLNGDLTPWTEEGVLLLNTSLTTEPFKPNAHKNLGWEELAKEVVLALSEDTKRRVFILWGRNAQAYEQYVDQSKHLVIKSAHPSPLSANYGFFGSKPFSKANAYLKDPINWSLEGQPQPKAPAKKKRSMLRDFDPRWDDIPQPPQPITYNSTGHQWTLDPINMQWSTSTATNDN